MAKQPGRFKNRPTGLAAFVGRALGKLAAQRDRLAAQLAGVESEIEDVQQSLMKLAPAPPARRKAAGGPRREISAATRKKMAAAAKARWAAARKAGKDSLR